MVFATVQRYYVGSLTKVNHDLHDNTMISSSVLAKTNNRSIYYFFIYSLLTISKKLLN